LAQQMGNKSETPIALRKLIECAIHNVDPVVAKAWTFCFDRNRVRYFLFAIVVEDTLQLRMDTHPA